MKKPFARIISVLMTLTVIFSLTACGPSKALSSNNSGVTIKIGILQIVEHPSLNTIRESLIKELTAKGYKDGENITIDYQNAQGDQTNLKTIALPFAEFQDCRIIYI